MPSSVCVINQFSYDFSPFVSRLLSLLRFSRRDKSSIKVKTNLLFIFNDARRDFLLMDRVFGAVEVRKFNPYLDVESTVPPYLQGTQNSSELMINSVEHSTSTIKSNVKFRH